MGGKLRTQENYKQLAIENLDKLARLLQEGPRSLTYYLQYTYEYAVYWFYLKDFERAREASLVYSLFTYDNNEKIEAYSRIIGLFQSALFRGLALHSDEANQIWQQIIDLRRSSFIEADIYQKKPGWRIGCAWVYEAYALTKLGRYAEVTEPARIGHEAIRRGKGINPTPYVNALEFGLSKVLIELANYQLSPDEKQKKAAQKALQAYKDNNFKYYRMGYAVIFDLQFTYPDVFTPVLPGSNPDMD